MIPYTIPEKITQVTFESTDYIIPAGKRYLDQLVKLLDKQKYKGSSIDVNFKDLPQVIITNPKLIFEREYRNYLPKTSFKLVVEINNKPYHVPIQEYQLSKILETHIVDNGVILGNFKFGFCSYNYKILTLMPV